jgi:anti-sigma-K factor RskA
VNDDHVRFEDDLAAYMLEALTADAVREFERHMAGCSRCQERARWLQGSVEMLPATVEQLEPPPALRERLMETVRSEAATPPRPRRAERRRRRARFGNLMALPRPAIALGLALIAVAAVTGYALGTGGDNTQTSTISAQVDPSLRGAHATLEREGDNGLLRVSGLPQHSDRIYQVWIEEDGAVRSAGLFQVDRSGSGAAAIEGELDRADRVMVSLEPPRGSPQPTSDPLVVAET